jgi:DNA mismatch repair protein MutL
MGRIHHLSDALINQIAAGEVVERPASVVKELCENAVDAGAACIRVRLAGGGLELISVVDDGHGMSREDALLCLERHATSKLVDAEGLSAIVTKGFRGEALPSIASVSRLTLTTSEPGAERGTRVELSGGGALTVADAAPFGGTRLEVADLFFNTPARRKFLKREVTELGHCEEAVVRLALAHPEIGFFLEHDGRSIISSPAATAHEERIGALLGTEVLPHLLKVDERRLGVSVSGFIASPELTLPTARGLYTFVNHRYVRDRGVTSAVQRAYQDTLPPGRQPMTVLFLEVDPAAVDVNVHPQKLEVRFAEPRAIQEVLAAAIGGALRGAPWRQGVPESTQEVHAHYALAVERFLARAQPGEPSPTEAGLPLAHDGGRLPFGTARPSINEAPPPGFFSQLRFLGELGRRFWLCEGLGGTLVVVDPRAVKERLAFGRLRARAHDRRGPAGPAVATSSLFSATVELPAAELDGVLAKASWLEQLGLELEAFGGTTLLLRGAPPELEAAGLSGAAWAALLLQLASIESSAADALDEGLGRLAAAAVPEGWRAATHAEVHAQLQALDEADFSGASRRARVVVHQLPLLELEALAQVR